MDIDHSSWVYLAKSLGLFYLIGLSIAVVVYACWPANRESFDNAAQQILDDDEDKPCP